MYPNNFLKTYWRMEVRDTVFVAMDFGKTFQTRYDEVFKPAIEEKEFDGGLKLKAHKVDLSTTGDSILTDILDGIAHCRLFLADVSVVGDMVRKNERTGDSELIPVRNSNVLYEVGIALACRQPEEVLIVRDDHRDKFLFDIAVFPYKTIDFSDKEKAKERVRELIQERLREQKFIDDARVDLAFRRLTSEELKELRKFTGILKANPELVREVALRQPHVMMSAVPRLVDKGLFTFAGMFLDGTPGFFLTDIGYALVKRVLNMPRLRFEIDGKGSKTLGRTTIQYVVPPSMPPS